MFTTAKTVSLLVIFFLSFLSGVISCVAVLCLQRKYGLSGRFLRIKSLLTCFSGGVFFATSITTLLPEAREKMEEVFILWDFNSEYPLSELLVGVGFLFILGFENISHYCCSINQTRKTNGLQTSDVKEERYIYIPETNVVFKRSSHYENDETVDSVKVNVETDFIKHERNSKKNQGKAYENSDVIDEKELTNAKADLDRETNASDHTRSELERTGVLNGKMSYVADASTTTSADAVVDETQYQMKSKIRGLILLVALSLHMVFDGLAIGLLEEDRKVWTLLLALSIHKLLVFLSVGIETFELFKSLPKSIIILFFFALVSPLGIMIGVAVTQSEDKLSQSVASAVLQSLAAGTFIYVTFFEILQKEYEGGPPGLMKVSLTSIGFALIAAVKALEGVDFG